MHSPGPQLDVLFGPSPERFRRHYAGTSYSFPPHTPHKPGKMTAWALSEDEREDVVRRLAASISAMVSVSGALPARSAEIFPTLKCHNTSYLFAINVKW